ncbi:acid phosphatase [Verrucomicrobiota bacterium]|nr:acid phosphatase [Verrucomicrobiota bacterium]
MFGPMLSRFPLARSQCARAVAVLWVCLAPFLCNVRAAVPPVQTVFVIVLENNNWAAIKGSSSAPYLNNVLLPQASYCEQYYNPPGLHPSEPNYIWLEAASNLGIVTNDDPAINHRATTNHLVALLRAAGVSWKSYQEDISGAYVPLTATNRYAPKHNPMVFFDDVTGTNNPADPYGRAHIRPYSELWTDLANHTVPRYCFITPNLCNDGHDNCPPGYNRIRQGDDWLATEIPKITNSPAYQNNGAIFIVWDEGLGSDGPIGLIVLSPLARGGGYFNNLHYTHSSFVRTMQDIFGVNQTYLADATNARDLFDLFTPFAVASAPQPAANAFQLEVTGVILGKTNLLQMSAALPAWTTIATNVLPVNALSNRFQFTDTFPTATANRFYRVLQLP